MGITLTAFNGISIVAMAWINTKIPLFSILIANKNFEALDSVFSAALKQSFFLIVLSVTSFTGILFFFQYQDISQGLRELANRFLPARIAIFIGLNTIVNHLIFSMAAYLRSHKKEPLIVNSVVGGILTLPLVYYSAAWFGVSGVVIANFILTFVVGLTWVTIIFFSKKRLWHKVS